MKRPQIQHKMSWIRWHIEPRLENFRRSTESYLNIGNKQTHLVPMKPAMSYCFDKPFQMWFTGPSLITWSGGGGVSVRVSVSEWSLSRSFAVGVWRRGTCCTLLYSFSCCRKPDSSCHIVKSAIRSSRSRRSPFSQIPTLFFRPLQM